MPFRTHSPCEFLGWDSVSLGYKHPYPLSGFFAQLGFVLFFEIRSLRIAQNDLERYPPALSSQVLNYRCAPQAKVFLLCLRAYLETWPLAEVLGRWL